MNDAEFREANEMFHAMLVQIKLAGKGSVTHKESISQEDFLKIKSSLDVNSPKGLQNKVFMDLCCICVIEDGKICAIFLKLTLLLKLFHQLRDMCTN